MNFGDISVSSVRSRPCSPPHLNVPSIALHSFEEWNPELADAARGIYDDINRLELYVKSYYCLMVLTLTFPSLVFSVKHPTVVALDSVIPWYDERLTMLMYSLTHVTFADMGTDG